LIIQPSFIRRRLTDDTTEVTNTTSQSHVNLPDSTGSAGTFLDGELSWMVDTSHFAYRQRSMKGEIFNSPMTRHWRRYDNFPRTYESYDSNTEQYGTTGQTYRSEVLSRLHQKNSQYLRHAPAPRMVSDSDVLAMEQSASRKAMADVKSAPVDGAVIVGELRETLGYLKNPLKSLTDLLLRKRKLVREWRDADLRRISRRDVNNQLDRNAVAAGGSAYLSVVFGAMPLLQDVESIINQAYSQSVVKKPPRATARGFEQEYVSSSESVQHLFGTGVYQSHTIQTFMKHEVTVRAGMLYQQDMSPLAPWGTRIRDIPSALWEVIPFSFLVDYVIDVGDYVAAAVTYADTPDLASWITTKHSVTVQRTITDVGFIQGSNWSLVKSPAGSMDQVRFEDTHRRPADLSTYAFALPRFKWDLTSRQTANVLALLTQALKP